MKSRVKKFLKSDCCGNECVGVKECETIKVRLQSRLLLKTSANAPFFYAREYKQL